MDSVLLLFFSFISATSSSCPGTTKSPAAISNKTTADLDICDRCSVIFLIAYDIYVLNGNDACGLDAFSIISCFERTNGSCDHTFSFLILNDNIAAALYLNNGINTSNWKNYEDVKNTFYDECPNGATKKLETVSNRTGTNIGPCNRCTDIFFNAYITYSVSGYNLCGHDVFSVISCFEDANGLCDSVFFSLMSDISDVLSIVNNIYPSTWQHFQDVKATYHEKCPDAYFTNLNRNITVDSDMSVDGVAYIIETNDDSASMAYGIILKEASDLFYLNTSNTLQVLVKRHLVSEAIEELVFDINSISSCGPGILTVTVKDVAPSTTYKSASAPNKEPHTTKNETAESLSSATSFHITSLLQRKTLALGTQTSTATMRNLTDNRKDETHSNTVKRHATSSGNPLTLTPFPSVIWTKLSTKQTKRHATQVRIKSSEAVKKILTTLKYEQTLTNKMHSATTVHRYKPSSVSVNTIPQAAEQRCSPATTKLVLNNSKTNGTGLNNSTTTIIISLHTTVGEIDTGTLTADLPYLKATPTIDLNQYTAGSFNMTFRDYTSPSTISYMNLVPTGRLMFSNKRTSEVDRNKYYRILTKVAAKLYTPTVTHANSRALISENTRKGNVTMKNDNNTIMTSQKYIDIFSKTYADSQYIQQLISMKTGVSDFDKLMTKGSDTNLTVEAYTGKQSTKKKLENTKSLIATNTTLTDGKTSLKYDNFTNLKHNITEMDLKHTRLVIPSNTAVGQNVTTTQSYTANPRTSGKYTVYSKYSGVTSSSSTGTTMNKHLSHDRVSQTNFMTHITYTGVYTTEMPVNAYQTVSYTVTDMAFDLSFEVFTNTKEKQRTSLAFLDSTSTTLNSKSKSVIMTGLGYGSKTEIQTKKEEGASVSTTEAHELPSYVYMNVSEELYNPAHISGKVYSYSTFTPSTIELQTTTLFQDRTRVTHGSTAAGKYIVSTQPLTRLKQITRSIFFYNTLGTTPKKVNSTLPAVPSKKSSNAFHLKSKLQRSTGVENKISALNTVTNLFMLLTSRFAPPSGEVSTSKNFYEYIQNPIFITKITGEPTSTIVFVEVETSVDSWPNDDGGVFSSTTNIALIASFASLTAFTTAGVIGYLSLKHVGENVVQPSCSLLDVNDDMNASAAQHTHPDVNIGLKESQDNVDNATYTIIDNCDMCVNVSVSAIREYSQYEFGICGLDVFAITSCFKGLTGHCTFTHFQLVAGLLSTILLPIGIDTSTWQSHHDLKKAYDENCPEAYFINQNTSITVNSDVPVGEVVYIIETSNDVAAAHYGITMKTKSEFFDLSSTNKLHLLVARQLVSGMTEELMFEINSLNNCGPAQLTVFVKETVTSTYTVSNGNVIPSGNTNAYSTIGIVTKTVTEHTYLDGFSLVSTNVPIKPSSTYATYTSKVTNKVSIRPITEYSYYISTATTDSPTTQFKRDATAKSSLAYVIHFTSFRADAAVKRTVTTNNPITPFGTDAPNVSNVTTDVHVSSFVPNAADNILVTTDLTTTPLRTNTFNKSILTTDVTFTPLKTDGGYKSMGTTAVPTTSFGANVADKPISTTDVHLTLYKDNTAEKSLVTTDVRHTSFRAIASYKSMVTVAHYTTQFRVNAFTNKPMVTTYVFITPFEADATIKSIVATYDHITTLKENAAKKSMVTTDVPITSLGADGVYSSIITSFVPVTPFITTLSYRSMATADVHITSSRAYAPNRTPDNETIRRSIFRNSITKVPVTYYSTNSPPSSNYEREYNDKRFFMSKANIALIITAACLTAFVIVGVIIWCLCFKHKKRKECELQHDHMRDETRSTRCFHTRIDQTN